jgi:hypothetical protein
MKNFIVITSIFAPTEAVLSFSKLVGYHLVVVGDKKTPADWHCEGASYLAADGPDGAGHSLSKVLPSDHYCRKMMGYLYSMSKGADTIIDTDDDNIPGGRWGFPAPEGHFSFIPEGYGFINIYRLYTDQVIWPRGFPLDLVAAPSQFPDRLVEGHGRVGVWQGLADRDPDVDAIYRLTNAAPCYFRERPPVVLGKNTISPFNSQNTWTRRELFPLLYLPAGVNFRFTDILRGLVAQPIMWLYDYHLGFTHATVVQQRNPHDPFSDFIDEIPMYRHAGEVAGIVSGVVSGGKTMADNLFNAYTALEGRGIVNGRELIVLEAWLRDVESLGYGR